MTETVRSADGTAIAYERTGGGPPLIVIGGALNTRQSPAALLPLLAERFTVFTYDRRGRGESTDSPPYAVEREIEDLGALASATGGEVRVYGHSSGAILALEAAAAGLDIRQLACYEPPYSTGGEGQPWEDFVAHVQSLVEAGRRDEAVEAFIRHTGADFDPGMKDSPWWPALTGVAHTLPYDLTLTKDGVVPAARFAAIPAQTLVLYGGASPGWARASAEAVAATVPNARVDVVEHQGHGVAPEALAPVLLGFFA